MYDFFKKTELSRRAKTQHLDIYRAMLTEKGNPAAGWVSPDSDSLAEQLLYILLDSYTIEEIEARTATPLKNGTPELAKTPQNDTAGTVPVKKKSINTKSILELTGKTWTALTSGLRTAFSQIELAAGSVLRSLKN